MRRSARKVAIGSQAVGGESPVSVQSMTNTPTSDIESTLQQINSLKEAGCEIVRVAVPDFEAAAALKVLKKKTAVPLVADIHFDYRLAMESMRSGADCIRLNPGNIFRENEVELIAGEAKKRAIPIRIGVNSGSIRKNRETALEEAMVESARAYARLLENSGFSDIIISLKAPDVPVTIRAYRKMAGICDYPFHLGITAAGPSRSGIVRSSAGIGILLSEGIGDTIRVSLTGEPVEEVKVGFEILDCLGLRTKKEPVIISCPTCGRCAVDLLKMVESVEDRIEKLGLSGKLEGIKIAVMGCPVNGPGEAKGADIGIACGRGRGALFKKGKVLKTAEADRLVGLLLEELCGIAKIQRGSAR